jgi:hypothetical protein
VANELTSGKLIVLNLEDISFEGKVESRISKLANHYLGVMGLDVWESLVRL